MSMKFYAYRQGQSGLYDRVRVVTKDRPDSPALCLSDGNESLFTNKEMLDDEGFELIFTGEELEDMMLEVLNDT